MGLELKSIIGMLARNSYADNYSTLATQVTECTSTYEYTTTTN